MRTNLKSRFYCDERGDRRCCADCRRKRCTAKDTTQLTGRVVVWIKENRGIIKNLERLLGEVRKVKRQMTVVMCRGRGKNPRPRR